MFPVGETRSDYGTVELTIGETATRRSARLLPARDFSNPIDADADDSDSLGDSMIGKYTRSRKVEDAASRGSLSSVSTSHDYNESSGYSTPTTSAFATPAPAKASSTETSTTRRGRRATAMLPEPVPSGISAVARAAALRNSQFSLDSTGNKRKRMVVRDSDDEDLDADEDDSPDAQLARALQKEENAAAASMTGHDNGYTPRRTPRKIQKLTSTSYSIPLSDDDDDFTSLKKPKVELAPKGSNAVSFSPKKTVSKKNSIRDTDDSDTYIVIDDSEEDMIAAPIRPRIRKGMSSRSDGFRAERQMSPPWNPASSAANAASRRGRVGRRNRDIEPSTAISGLTDIVDNSTSEFESEFDSDLVDLPSDIDSDDISDDESVNLPPPGASRRRIPGRAARQRLNLLEERQNGRARMERLRLEAHHPELQTMWQDLENLPKIGSVKIDQPVHINRELKPFQLEGVAWMRAMEQTEWGGGLLGDEMGMGKTIQAVSLIMSDFPAPQPSLVLIPPVALMQWQQEIADYTDGTLKTFVFHGTNAQTKGVTVEELMKYNVILMSYNSLESMYRKQEKGFKRKGGLHKEKSVIHQIHFHRVILDEAHNIKV